MQWRGWPPKTRHTFTMPKFGCSALKGMRINTGNPQKLRSPRTPLSCDGKRGWPEDAHPSATCYHVKFGSSVTKCVCINRRELPKLGSAGTQSIWLWWLDWPPEKKPSPQIFYHVKFVTCITKKNSRSVLAWSRPRADRGLSRPTSVFRTTIGVCKILSRSVEIWQYEGQKPKNRERVN